MAKAKWRQEPLVHFMLIGAALFTLYGLINDGEVEVGNRIEITDATVVQLSEGWQKTWQRPPTETELRGLINGYIREEVFVREALALGLDENDVIIRRRLAQKMEFITGDLARLAEPQDTDLRRFYEDNPDPFREPARLTFRQVYFNPDSRKDALADARALLELLRAGKVRNTEASSDRLMLNSNYDLVTEYDVSRTFGSKFAADLFSVEAESWQGPLESGYGIHLVEIFERQEARMPEFAAVREAVRAAWLDAEQERMEKEVFERLKSRYEIVFMTTGGQPQ